MAKSTTQQQPDLLANGCMVMAKGIFISSMKLFCKKTGEYFLHAKGGPLSVYRTYSGSNSWGGGEVIIPYTLGEAQKWAMEHMDGDAYEAEFGVVEE